MGSGSGQAEGGDARSAGASPEPGMRQRHAPLHRRRSIGGGETVVAPFGSPPLRIRLPDGRTPCVLVVEDNHMNVRVVSQQLRTLGVAVEVAPNGAVALQMLSRAPTAASTGGDGDSSGAGPPAMPYDLILMDLNMPVMDGYETTHAIRAHEARGRFPASRVSPLPIVAVTAEDESERARALASGMSDFLTKPVTRDGLRAVLQRLLALHPVE